MTTTKKAIAAGALALLAGFAACTLSASAREGSLRNDTKRYIDVIFLLKNGGSKHTSIGAGRTIPLPPELSHINFGFQEPGRSCMRTVRADSDDELVITDDCHIHKE